MKRRAVPTLGAWLCAACCLISGGMPSGGYLVCFGLDGHIDIGSIEDGCKDRDRSGLERAGVPEPQLGERDSCCPCVDVPVVAPGGFTASGLTRRCFEHPGPLFTPIPPPAFHLVTSGRTLALRSRPPDARSRAVCQLRSVILLA
jgi:hypothetical protein